MSELLRKQIHDWEYEKIKSNPRMYGGDKGSPLIMKAYIQEFHSGKKAEQFVNFTRSFQPFHKHVSTFLTVNQAVKL